MGYGLTERISCGLWTPGSGIKGPPCGPWTPERGIKGPFDGRNEIEDEGGYPKTGGGGGGGILLEEEGGTGGRVEEIVDWWNSLACVREMKNILMYELE